MATAPNRSIAASVQLLRVSVSWTKLALLNLAVCFPAIRPDRVGVRVMERAYESLPSW